MPTKADEIGVQTQEEPGRFYVGFTWVSPDVSVPGKVKDGVLYYGYGGEECQTREF